MLYAIPHEGTEGHESALWMATRDWLVVSIFGILALTLWPTYIWEDSPGIWGNIRILIDRPAWKSSLSVVPFSVFKDYYEDLLKSPVYFFVTLINFFGNLAMFIPIGFFSALLFRNATLKRSAIIGFGMSTFIEFAQYFIMRNTAVDTWGNMRLLGVPFTTKDVSRFLPQIYMQHHTSSRELMIMPMKRAF